MNHIAIDLGSVKSQICVRDASAKILQEQPIATSALLQWLREQAPGRVILETCTEAYAVARAAKAIGHEVKVVPATLVKQLGMVSGRRLKSDRNDARLASEVSTRIELPSVHVPSLEAQEILLVCNLRSSMVEARTKLVNSAKAYVRGQLVELEKGEAETVPKRIREAFADKLSDAVERVLVSIDALNEQIKAADKEAKALAKKNPLCVR